MKKLIILAIIASFSITSCGSGWSCQKRYVNKSNSQKLLEYKHKMSKKQNT